MRDAKKAGVTSGAFETVMPWQQSIMQIAMKGQFFSFPELSLWQGISSVIAAEEFIAMSDDIPGAGAIPPAPAAEIANGAIIRLPINRMASVLATKPRSIIGNDSMPVRLWEDFLQAIFVGQLL
jgi:hypothetical protein